MNLTQLQRLLAAQRTYFASGKTLPVKNRLAALRMLRETLLRREKDIYAALREDLGKSQAEAYMSELGMILSEIRHMLCHAGRYAARRKAHTPLAQFAASSYELPCPRGVCLIMSPWNYPLLLTLDPLVDALAAGNTAVIKPSAYAPRTGHLLKELIEDTFDPAYVTVITGGREENHQLLEQKFDFIFFTGSTAVGKEVLKAAAPNLTPVMLELGGKSPCIVDETADIALAARRIVFGKFLNCGQTCVAPDYVVCQESVFQPLMTALKQEITRQYGADPLQNRDYGNIISEKHMRRLLKLMDGSPVFFGGKADPKALRLAPALLSPCSWEDPVMQEEIFGPLLPVLTYSSLTSLLEIINSRPHPLALYFFSHRKKDIHRVLTACPFGGGCINDTVIHLATAGMGFGGVGSSGMGAYHGRAGFDAFSHRKSIVDKRTFVDLPMRYAPYQPFYVRLIRIFLR